MRNTRAITLILILLILTAASVQSFAQDASIPLPAPNRTGGKPLMEALDARMTTRTFSTRELDRATLGNLLWAAWGVNRPDGRRTAPSASNRQEIDVYAATAEGVFRYDAQSHALVPVLKEDIRALTGTQPFVATAPLNLIYVADLSKMGSGEEEGKLRTANADTGFIGQNVYLFCASEGLATVVRGMVDRETLAAKMNLRPDQRITLSQTVGYPE